MNRKIERYIIFGIMTTAINIASFYMLDKLKIDYKINTTISNFISIIFAYITNKLFVFKVEILEIKFLIKEVLKFFISRIGTYFLDIFSMCILVEIFIFNEVISKIFSNILVIMVNYLLSNFYIFGGKKK